MMHPDKSGVATENETMLKSIVRMGLILWGLVLVGLAVLGFVISSPRNRRAKKRH